MARMLADGKDTLIQLDEWPDNPRTATVADVEGTDASCVVGKSGFQLGAGAPTTTTDNALCQEGEMQIPTAKTYEAAYNIYRFFDAETGQIDETEDFFFQAHKNFGDEIYLAYREGGKTHDQEPEAGDEWSFYKIIVGGMGRTTERDGYSKRVAHVSVAEAVEDVILTA